MEKKSIAELKTLVKQDQLTTDMINLLKQDERKGVQTIIKNYERQQEKDMRLKEQFYEMMSYERECRNQGYRYIAGVDEAGRGPLAGPVVAAAVILPSDFKLIGLNDSKLLNINQREKFFEYIKEQAIAYYVSIVDNQKIDEINIFEATKFAMREALNKLDTQADYALIDAVYLNEFSYPTKNIIKGDQKSISIAAASILAKVTRDHLMKKLHIEYPMYDFVSNMGYGTKKHIEQLQAHGVSPYHRRSFAPVRAAMK